MDRDDATAEPVSRSRVGPVRTRRWGLAAVAGLDALSAWGGAIGLVSGWLSLGPDIERRLPFESPVLAGAALGALVALPASAVTVAAIRGDDRADRLAAITGASLVGWIALQLAVLREFSFFQPVYAMVGVTLVLMGRRSWWRRPAR